MKNRTHLLLVLFMLVNMTVFAQQGRLISMKEAITLSIRNSKELKKSTAKIDEANALLHEARDRQLPDARISGAYMHLSSANVDLKTGGSGGGGAPEVSQVLYGMANVSFPLFAGGKIAYGIESARYLARAATLDAENNKTAVIKNAIAAYINLYKAKVAIDLVKDNLVQSQQRVKDFSNLEKNGLLARNDLLKAELQQSNTELTLLDAENNWQLARVNMNLMLGLPENTELRPEAGGVEERADLKTLMQYEEDALSRRKDAEALEMRKRSAMLGLKSAKADRYPSLALTGGYVALDVPNFVTVTNAANIGIGLSYNLSSLWKTKAKTEQARAISTQLEASSESLNETIRLQVNQAYFNMLSSRKKIEVYAKAVEQAQENYRITNNKYRNSLATTTDLLDADVAQLQAKLNYEFAKADAVLAYNDLLQTTGTLQAE